MLEQVEKCTDKRQNQVEDHWESSRRPQVWQHAKKTRPGRLL